MLTSGVDWCMSPHIAVQVKIDKWTVSHSFKVQCAKKKSQRREWEHPERQKHTPQGLFVLLAYMLPLFISLCFSTCSHFIFRSPVPYRSTSIQNDHHTVRNKAFLFQRGLKAEAKHRKILSISFLYLSLSVFLSTVWYEMLQIYPLNQALDGKV